MMANVRLPKLPDRTPVKLGIQVTPQRFADLTRDAGLYKEASARDSSVSFPGPLVKDGEKLSHPMAPREDNQHSPVRWR